MPGAFFFSGPEMRKRKAELRKDAEALGPGELIAVRRLLRAVQGVPEHIPAPMAAERLGLTVATVRKLVKRGDVQGRRGKPVLVCVESLKRWLGVHDE